MTMLFYIAYAVSLGGWRLMKKGDDGGLGKAARICPVDIIDIMLEPRHRPLSPSHAIRDNCSKGGVLP